MKQTYNDFMNEVLLVKADFQRQFENHGWNYKESEHQLKEFYEYIITNRAGLTVLVRFDEGLGLVQRTHMTDNEIHRMYALIKDMN